MWSFNVFSHKVNVGRHNITVGVIKLNQPIEILSSQARREACLSNVCSTPMAVFNRCLCFLPKKEEEAILHTAAVCHVGHECFELTHEIRIRHSVKLALKGETPTQENYR